ncbi:unnamed protein product [Calicophoron daubneyi]|uniref:Nostrin n=1 Tax=Calicophoron daubneyi TaxID=300641 RepID=A0AAV2TYX5_CALDB
MDGARQVPNCACSWGYEKQFSEHKQAVNVTQNVINIVQEKSELHSTYSRGLFRLGIRLRDVLGSTPGGTVHTAWLKVVSSLEAEAKMHQTFASVLLEELVRPWNQLFEELTKARKPLKAQVEKVTDNLLTLCTGELKAKKKLYAAYRTCERSWYTYAQSTHTPPKMNTIIALGDNINSSSNNDNENNGGIDISKADHVRHASLSNGSCRSTSLASPDHSLSPTNSVLSSHSFRSVSRDSSADLHRNSSTLRSRQTTLGRSRSERAATLPSPTSTTKSVDSSTSKVSSLVEKSRSACYASLCEYYKATMAAEEARVEWHTVLLKCLQDQRNLERQRLEMLVKGITVYRRLMDDIIPAVKASANDLAEAVRFADPSVDLQNFRRRSQLDQSDSALSSVNSHSSPNRLELSDIDSKDKQSTSFTAVGRSQQRLLDVPGEIHLRPKNGNPSKNSTDSNPILNVPDDAACDKPNSSCQSANDKSRTLSSSMRSSLQGCLTRECLFEQLDLLARDVIKERRTKQGLTNLVQVYSRHPAYADDHTLAEARRRLFVSRVRLNHLTHCRQKIVCSLIHGLSDVNLPSAFPVPRSSYVPSYFPKTPSSPHIYLDSLLKAGFRNLPWDYASSGKQDSITSQSSARWIALPDLDEEKTRCQLSKPLEWPPVSAAEIPNEDLNETLFEWELDKLRQLHVDECDDLMSVYPFGDFGENLEMIDSETFQPTRVPAKSFPSDQEKKKVGPVLSTPSPTSGCSRDIEGSAHSARPSSLAISSGVSRIHQSFNTPSVILPKAQSSLESKHHTSSFSKQNVKLQSTNFTASEKSNGGLRGPLADDDKSIENSTSLCTSSLPITVPCEKVHRPKFFFRRFEKSGEEGNHSSVSADKNPSVVTDSLPSAIRKDLVVVTEPKPLNLATFDEDHLESEAIASPVASDSEVCSVAQKKQKDGTSFSGGSSLFAKLRMTGHRIRRRNSKVESSPHDETSIVISSPIRASVQKASEPVVGKKTAANSKVQGPFGLAITHPPARSVHFGVVESHAITPDGDFSPDKSEWPSTISLHCLGWAKVERGFTARCKDELTLLEGDIVSIYRKDNPFWWYGEVNGVKGRFPVNNVEEF